MAVDKSESLDGALKNEKSKQSIRQTKRLQNLLVVQDQLGSFQHGQLFKELVYCLQVLVFMIITICIGIIYLIYKGCGWERMLGRRSSNPMGHTLLLHKSFI